MALSRRAFLQSSLIGAAALGRFPAFASSAEVDLASGLPPLDELGYSQVELQDGPARRQFQSTIELIRSLSSDSLLRPFRLKSGLPAPGPELGGWYAYNPAYSLTNGDVDGFAPGHCFGQWMSALARASAIETRPEQRRALVAAVRQLVDGLGDCIRPQFFQDARFPAYTFDKLVCGLIDSHQWAGVDTAFPVMERVRSSALPYLPPRAIDRDKPYAEYLAGTRDASYCWDESYTLPENLYLAYARGAGSDYRDLARRFLLDETYFKPLSEGHNALIGKHAYSYANALSSAVQAYLVDNSQTHLKAAVNGFAMLQGTQSYATGGWGPGERFRPAGELIPSLDTSHDSFETPCGSYAHFKLTRALLRITRDSRYGDSMERVLYNAILGALPLQSDGRAFYYSDNTYSARKLYFKYRWPCCAGPLAQVTADYGISSYLRDREGLFVNLYLPSKVRWQHEGQWVELSQSSSYPNDEDVELCFDRADSVDLKLALRIPAWAAGATVRVNREPSRTCRPGQFTALSRTWVAGDRVHLHLPLQPRLESLDPGHPEIVALVRGPLVLFPIHPDTGIKHEAPLARRSDLLSVRRTGATSYQAGEWQLRPFVDIADESYSTYFKVE